LRCSWCPARSPDSIPALNATRLEVASILHKEAP